MGGLGVSTVIGWWYIAYIQMVVGKAVQSLSQNKIVADFRICTHTHTESV